jgi:anti-sigma factor RsiW
MNASDPEHAHRCRDFLERLSRYLDDDLPSAQRRVIEKHLAECPCCEDVLASLQDTIALCHEKGRPPMPRDVRARARQRVRDLLKEYDVKAGK